MQLFLSKIYAWSETWADKMALKMESQRPSWGDLIKFKPVHSPKMVVADFGMTPSITQETALTCVAKSGKLYYTVRLLVPV